MSAEGDGKPLVGTRRRLLMATGLVVILIVAGGALLIWMGPGNTVAALLGRDATWAVMQDRGAFRVGMDPSFPPFELLNGEGAPVGFDVDLANALAEDWNLELEIVALGFDSLIDALRASRVDAVISAMPYDERLTRDVRYSTPYFDAGIRLAVREGAPIGAVEDLAGKRVAVEWGSTGDMIARQLQRDRGIALEIVPFESPESALEAASTQSGIDAVLIDQVSLRLAQGKGMPLHAAGDVLESAPYVIVTPRRASTLAQSVQSALKQFEGDGTLARLEERWFGPAPSPNDPNQP